MASLDKMEGDAVEFIAVLILAVLAFALWEVWHGADSAGQAAANLLRKLWQSIDAAFNSLVTALTPQQGSVTGGGPDVVYTGSNMDANNLVVGVGDGSGNYAYYPGDDGQ